MELSEKIRQAITDSLPQVAANELKDFIEKANDTTTKLKLAEVALTESKNKIENLRRLETLEITLKSKEATLIADSDKLKEEQRNLKVEKLEYQLAEAKTSTNKIFELVALLVKNPRAVEFMATSEHQAGFSNGNNYVQPSPIYKEQSTERFETKSPSSHPE